MFFKKKENLSNIQHGDAFNELMAMRDLAKKEGVEYEPEDSVLMIVEKIEKHKAYKGRTVTKEEMENLGKMSGKELFEALAPLKVKGNGVHPKDAKPGDYIIEWWEGNERFAKVENPRPDGLQAEMAEKLAKIKNGKFYKV